MLGIIEAAVAVCISQGSGGVRHRGTRTTDHTHKKKTLKQCAFEGLEEHHAGVERVMQRRSKRVSNRG